MAEHNKLIVLASEHGPHLNFATDEMTKGLFP